MTLRRRLACLLALGGLAVSLPAMAQNCGPIHQTGPMVPGHLLKFDTNCLAEDSGLSAAGVAAAGTSMLLATSYGVVADGITSNDGALATAVNACSAARGSLWLPAGGILLTGTQSINLHDCRLVGQGVVSVGSTSSGTTILLVSQATTPFILGSGVGIEGVNFYWPNQVSGTTVYPALFDTSATVSSFWMDHSNILNAYDGWAASVSTGGIGRWYITNSNLYALHDLFRIGGVGDFMLFNGTIFDPGAWLDATNFSSTTKAAIDAANTTNSIFHLIQPTGVGAVIFISNGGAFSWGYGFKLDALASWSFGSINSTFDGVQTLIDSSSGGTVGNVSFSCQACTVGRGSYTGLGAGNKTAFNLGANGGLRLNNSIFNTAAASFIISAGASVDIAASSVSLADPGDGAEYYAVQFTGGSGKLRIKGSTFGGANTIHSHGIYKHVALPDVQIQNNRFELFNDDIDITTNDAKAPLIQGNYSATTFGTASVLISGTNAVNWWGNEFDKPPLAQVSSCGSGATITGAVAGKITVGSTNPTTSCTLTLPWAAYGDNLCQITGSTGGAITQAPTSFHPLTLTITSASDMHNGVLAYSCPGQQ